MNQLESVPKLVMQPFSAENLPKDCRINILFSKDNDCFQVVFELATQLTDLTIPSFEPSKVKRKDKLWEHTCFEIFLGYGGSPNYWEFNLSPSGDWNVYSFSGYREGMREDASFEGLPFKVQILSERELRLAIAIDFSRIPILSDLNVGVSAVLEQKNGIKSYWAVKHPGEVPDFHAREGWFQI
jgi:hypothetical protein